MFVTSRKPVEMRVTAGRRNVFQSYLELVVSSDYEFSRHCVPAAEIPAEYGQRLALNELFLLEGVISFRLKFESYYFSREGMEISV